MVVKQRVDAVVGPRPLRRRADSDSDVRFVGSAGQDVRLCQWIRPPQPVTKQVTDGIPGEASGAIGTIGLVFGWAMAHGWQVFPSSGE
jgi:hypothetical protein